MTGRGAGAARPAKSGNGAAEGAVPSDRIRSGRSRPPRAGGRRRRKTPERVARRPDPAEWSADELLALHEAIALLWPAGPLTVSSLRTAIARGDLACARIAGRIYTTRAALAAMTECRRASASRGRPSDADWEAHLATLLKKRRAG
ncbi:hypothetical protein [Bradyrhizobium ottawaense]|uniref:DNA-binding protein n=1 Tax=Bradyrhizobium ottawaense TaxID=931866 RepID=A0ABV4FR77_9BRAD|nr:hypothetical protein [Bradyrhizobium ottawaense]MBR1292883.1 hypothetical protein [Bradyrhizobium ottawaense]WLB45999.1 hypothetical protein QIH93_36930 [Bradyrhizobium ottawaense]WQN83281.1 hypothetical protein U7859_02030 [Bradyrhizobium ottawaense]GMO49514.1 hypothetical protein BwSF21_69780 [Bradyrhizobium ottawaense]GMO53551.1 hypothetical protein BwSF12_65290 [Bradyrhizobium ottawaense]